MRKIFLTSGLVVCMACPAFAETGFTAQEVATAAAQASPNTNVIADACVNENLNSYTGPVELTAQWDRSYFDITLNTNTSANGSAGTAFDTGTAETSKIYATSQYVYKTRSGDSADSYALTDQLGLNSQVIVNTEQSPIPTGKTVSLTFNPNYNYINNTLNATTSGTGYSPTSYGTTNWASITNVPADSNATRLFTGFYADATDETGGALINASGQLTQPGINAALALTANTTWYAHYACATPAHDGTPVLRGYHFDGWYDNASTTGSAISDWCLTNDSTEVYAKWTAHTGTLTYNCGSLPQGNTGTLSGDGSIESVVYDKGVTLKDASTAGCSVQGYHFIGWKCDYNLATGDTYSGSTANYTYTSVGPAHTSGSFDDSNNVIDRYGVVAPNGSNNANVTCIAQWAPNTIGLTWKDGTTASGGNTINVTGTAAANCEYDNSITLPDVPQRTGYTFTGWSVTNPAPAQTSEPTEPAGGQG